MMSLRGKGASSAAMLLFLALLAGPRLAAAAPAEPDALRVEMARAAGNIKQFLGGQGRTSIAVGTFTAGGGLKASAGPNLHRLLVEELKKLGIDVRTRDELTVEGRYIDVDDRKTRLLAAKITFRIVDRRDKEQVTFEREVFGDATLPTLFGISAELGPTNDARERDRRLREGLDKPRVVVKGAQVASKEGSPYAIAVLVEEGGEYRERKPTIKDGLAFVSIRRDEKYAVRLINDSQHEAAVTLSIDGINMFAFMENPPRDRSPDSQVLVDAKKPALIRGWYRNSNESEEFLVTDYAKSAATELKQSAAEAGTITAVFSAAWPRDGQPPPDERGRDAQLGTRRGKRIAQKYIEVERNIGVVRATISVRYDR